jgi:hypothetical protein
MEPATYRERPMPTPSETREETAALHLEAALRAVRDPAFDRRLAYGHLQTAIEEACRVLRGEQEAREAADLALFGRMGD